jgi:hypothetical protein
MSIHPVSDPTTPIGEILKAAGSEGVLLESEEQGRFALLPLDDEVIDLLIERNSEFHTDCLEIRKRMDAGQFTTHQDARRQLLGE